MLLTDEADIIKTTEGMKAWDIEACNQIANAAGLAIAVRKTDAKKLSGIKDANTGYPEIYYGKKELIERLPDLEILNKDRKLTAFCSCLKR
jgi:hypothetical protein